MRRFTLLLFFLVLPAYAAPPVHTNPNNLTFISVDSTTGTPAAPYVDGNGNMNVTGAVAATVTGDSGAYTDRSGTITAGGVSQTLAAVNASRKYLLISNPPDAASQGIAVAEKLCINFTSAASLTAAGSVCLAPGVTWVMGGVGGFVSTELVTVVAATTAHNYTAKEY